MTSNARKRPPIPTLSTPLLKRRQVEKKVPYIVLNLTEKSTSLLGLNNPWFLEIPKVEYLHNLSKSNRFLYEIVSRICDVGIESVTLLRQANGIWASESEAGWKAVAMTGDVSGGEYLCEVNDGKLYYKSSLTVGDCKVLNIDPVLISVGGDGGSTVTSAASSREGSVWPTVKSTIPDMTSSPTKKSDSRMIKQATAGLAAENFIVMTKAEKDKVWVCFMKLITSKQDNLRLD
jgi:hypothetical protein